jgi:hypothetical protein
MAPGTKSKRKRLDEDSGWVGDPPAPSQQIPKEDSGASQSATKARIRACITEQRANNPALPKNDIEKYCESQVNGSPPG